MALLTALKPGGHGVRRQSFEAELLAPVGERFVRGAEAAGPVYRGGAADTAALQNRDGAIGGDPAHAFLVQIGVGRQLVHLEVFLIIQSTLFHQNH